MRFFLLCSAPLAAWSLAAAGACKHAPSLAPPRTEVTAALMGGREIVVVGGFLESGANSSRVDAFSPASTRWRRLPDLPVPVDHAMAASYKGLVYVVGGYGVDRRPLRSMFVFSGGAWRALPQLSEPRAAAGAAVAAGRLYVVGGIGPSGPATTALWFDLVRRRWSLIPGPTPESILGLPPFRGRCTP